MRILGIKIAKLMCGSRTEAMQKNKNILKSLAAAVHKNKCNAAGISKKTVHLSSTYKIEVVPVFIYLFIYTVQLLCLCFCVCILHRTTAH